MIFLQNISKKQSIFQWLLLMLLSSGIFAFQEAGYRERQIYINPVHHVDERPENLPYARSIYNFSASAKTSYFYEVRNKNQQINILKAFSNVFDAFVKQRLILFSDQFSNIKTGSTQHFLSRTFPSEEPSVFIS